MQMDYSQEWQYIKIVIVGNHGVGKSSIITRYDKNQFNKEAKASLGVDFFSKAIKKRNKNLKLTIWDTAGQQKYRTLSGSYFKGAHGVILTYDVTDPSSYKQVQEWLTNARQRLNQKEFVAIVVGNKNDRKDEKEIPFETVLKDYNQNQNIECWQVSAKTGQNVNQMFDSLAQGICDMLYGKEQKIDAMKVSAVGDIARAKRENKESSEVVDEPMSENKKTIKELTSQVQRMQTQQKQLKAKIQIHSQYIAKLKELIDSKNNQGNKVKQIKR